MDIPQLVRSYASEELIESLAGSIGEPIQRTSAATSAAIPAVLSLYVSEVSDLSGADAIYETLHNRGPSVLTDLPGTLAGQDAYEMIEEGSAQFKQVFGRHSSDGMASAISRFSGLGISSARSVVGIVNTLIVATLSKHSGAESGPDLASYIRENRTAIAESIPAGLHEYLDEMPNVRSVVRQDQAVAATSTDDLMQNEAEIPRQENVHNERYYEVDHNDADRFAALAWVVPLVLVLIVGAALMYVLSPQTPSPQPPVAQETLSPQSDDAAQPAAATLAPDTSALKSLQLAGDPTLGRDIGNGIEQFTASLENQSSTDALKEDRDSIRRVKARLANLPPDQRDQVAAPLKEQLPHLQNVASQSAGQGTAPLIQEIMQDIQQMTQARTP